MAVSTKRCMDSSGGGDFLGSPTRKSEAKRESGNPDSTSPRMRYTGGSGGDERNKIRRERMAIRARR